MNKITHDKKQGRLYWGAIPLPVDAEILGTITRANGETGALILMPAGRLMQGNAGALKAVDIAMKLTFDDFIFNAVGGESRISPGKAVWYILIRDGEEEFYREWEAVTGDFWSDVPDDELNDAFAEYVNHVLCKGGERHGKA